MKDIDLYPTKKIKYESVRSLRKIYHEVQILVIKDMVVEGHFLESLKDIRVGIATSSNSTKLELSDNFKNFVDNVMKKDNNKYVFHDVTKDEEARKIIPELIPLPVFIPAKSVEQLRICRLYAGGKHSGTNIHQHSAALNYLVSGKKLWITFPFNEKNKIFIERNNMRYGQVKVPAINWLINNHGKLIKENAIKDLKFFLQKRGEVAYVPPGHFHAVVNLEDVTGITYSWHMEKRK